MPVLEHDGFILSETAAILRYVNAAFLGSALVPADPREAERIAQVIGIADALAYCPLVRSVYAQLVLRPYERLASDPAQVAAGLVAADPALGALEGVAAEGLQLGGSPLSLADLHLGPMIAASASAPAKAALLADRRALAARWQRMAGRPTTIATRTSR